MFVAEYQNLLRTESWYMIWYLVNFLILFTYSLFRYSNLNDMFCLFYSRQNSGIVLAVVVKDVNNTKPFYYAAFVVN